MKHLKVISGILLSAMLAYGVYAIAVQLPNIRHVLMVLVLAIFLSIAANTKFDLALTATFISVGISYGAFLISLIISGLIVALITQLVSINNVNYVVAVTIIAAFMGSAIIIIFFRIKRFNRGMLFLKKKGVGAIGLILSGAVLLIIILISSGEVHAEQGAWLILGIGLCVLGLVAWWRRGLTKLYRERMKERNIQEYEKSIAEKDAEIELLLEDNEMMAKIIHRDNKLLPALYNSVLQLHRNASDEFHDSSEQLIAQIQHLMDDRAGILKLAQPDSPITPITGKALIDGLLSVMATKSAENDIEFDAVVDVDLQKLTDSVISVLQLQTLCADIIENAIISTAHSKCKKVHFAVRYIDNVVEICAKDSGTPFNPETLVNLGVKKASTHLDEGGGGIGYMAIFEILKQCNAGIVISEYTEEQHGFTKSVTIRFDGKFIYHVQSYRAAELAAMRDALERPDDSMCITTS